MILLYIQETFNSKENYLISITIKFSQNSNPLLLEMEFKYFLIFKINSKKIPSLLINKLLP